ncbi:transglycosylase SLT domain-containing protein [Aliivibrio sp. S4TY2]|uniref:transglycosylase SLT domain-containing protein n=1 Tax=unclassified Aliivibrio TaxID=2645654 RepID=UPI002379176C|nr:MULTISPECIES: transglycosylase SLT domain-containing protein [unclassified Aliivibrio]MDD9157605.1 transglycosylase SLT domain-containing protein [Aliivibrio sp. S4TY2]MDD9161432.1 transglycosylase SLT domain-containing protein [Aliivibrio sp. S4TY1]MDD9165515.1 transglycosylase SLT domain-containing protein [Aliivibrio sp. S4MY2]MDD9169461.1 transglycosylase SLT domain-containing protein [Aliivibrio sp. S4MY4]MDD9186454.1 transglycosylase SLT domain-containing protein [Aliivibrio sp. S4MY3
MNLRMRHWCIGMIFTGYCSEAVSVSELWLDRYAYDAIQQGFNKKDISVYDKKRASINGYSLAAYTDYRAFLFDIANKTPAQVNQFSTEYSDYPFSVSIRADYLNALIASKNWKALTEYQITLPRDQDYQCWYYTAHYHQGNTAFAFKGAESLWLNGESVSTACNELFSYWTQAGGKTDNEILQRALLAVESRNPRLITYLRKLASSEQSQDVLTEMLELYQKPNKMIMRFETKKDTVFNRAYAQTMFMHVARHDVAKAYPTFQFLMDHFEFEEGEFQPGLEFAAVRLLEAKDQNVVEWRDQIFENSSSDVVLDQRIRLAIRKADWKGIQHWVLKLPEESTTSYRWQYWLGRSEIELGDKATGEARLKRISGERHFYSVAAAISLNRQVKYPIARAEVNSEKLSMYESDIARIHELLALGKEGAAKSQWRHLISRTPMKDKALLTAYAKQQKWQAFVHDATLVGQLWDYIYLRFPVRYYDVFERYGKKHKVDVTSLLSLTRQESGFSPLVHSPVGALGLMQVLPSTATYITEKYNISYQQRSELFNVDKNVEIGSRYLGHLLNHYDQNRIFAYAAYNAGPTMVSVWRRQSNSNIDIFAYIEGISFKETRVYVKNILMFEMYYREIMGRKGPFLTQAESNWHP